MAVVEALTPFSRWDAASRSSRPLTAIKDELDPRLQPAVHGSSDNTASSPILH